MPRGRMKSSPLIVGALAPFARKSFPSDAMAQTDRDYTSITRTLEDYIRAWFSGDAEAMDRCLHPELTARLLQLGGDSAGTAGIRAFDRAQGIQASLGSCTHPMARHSEIAVLDVSGHSASARAVLGDWVAYMHLTFTGERWAIVNVLWEWQSPRNRRSA